MKKQLSFILLLPVIFLLAGFDCTDQLELTTAETTIIKADDSTFLVKDGVEITKAIPLHTGQDSLTF